MGRRRTIAVALLGVSLAGGSAAAAATLTAKNSIAYAFFAGSNETLRGVNCATTATLTKQLPAGAQGIKVVEPKVGDRDEGGGTRVVSVTVAGTAVTITVLADGPSICDPSQTGVPAGEPVNWMARYDVRAEYTRRVQATIRVYYESYVYGARWQRRPPTIRDTRRGGPPGLRVTHIRWKRFGGKTAVGNGTLRLDYCRRGENCPGNGGPIRLVASKPKYCKDSGKIEYLQLAGHYLGRDQFVAPITCSR